MSMKPRLKILLLHLDAQFFHSGSASTHVIAPCFPVYMVISELHVHYILSGLFKTANIVYYLISVEKFNSTMTYLADFTVFSYLFYTFKCITHRQKDQSHLLVVSKNVITNVCSHSLLKEIFRPHKIGSYWSHVS